MKHLQWTLIQAAVRHVQKATAGADKTALAVYYLKCVAAAYQQRGRYDISYQARQLFARIERDGAVNPVYKELRSMFGNSSAPIPSEGTPASNTGVKSPLQSSLEEYLSYEH